jgi:hypothetical protein
MWKKYCGAEQITDGSMTVCIACWILEHTHTHTQNIDTYCFSTEAVVTRTRRNVTLQVLRLSLFPLSAHA